MAMKTDPIIIKFGGEVVENEQLLSNLACSIKKLHQAGEKLILVHGGGPVATKLSKKLQLTPKMVGGRRITCKETLDVMKMSLSGIVNSNVLAILKKNSLPGVSASGISFINATTRPPRAVSGSDGKLIDFGYVGDIIDIDPDYLGQLLKLKYIPVVSPLCCDISGKMLNINADTVSTQIAKYTKAKALILVTAIGGVYRDINSANSRFRSLTIEQAKNLILDGTIQGGMIPKLEEGFKLLDNRLSYFHIVGVDTPDSIFAEIQTPGFSGSAIKK